VCGTQTVTVLLAKPISRRHPGEPWTRAEGTVPRRSLALEPENIQLPAAYPFPDARHEHHILAHFGRFDEAIAADTKARMLTGENAMGYRKQFLELMQIPVKPPEGCNSPFGIAILHAPLGEKSKAALAVQPAFDAMRPEPRFPAPLRRLDLYETTERNWAAYR